MPPAHRLLHYKVDAPVMRNTSAGNVFRNCTTTFHIPVTTQVFLRDICKESPEIRQVLENLCINALSSGDNIEDYMNKEYDTIGHNMNLPVFEAYLAIRADWRMGMDASEFVQSVFDSCIKCEH